MGHEKKQVGLKCERMWCEVNYFKNKVLSVAGLYGHFLCCLVSAAWASWVQSSTACARESLRLFMKYLSSLWGDMRKVTWKVKRTKQKRRLRRCQNDKYSYWTKLLLKKKLLRPQRWNCCVDVLSRNQSCSTEDDLIGWSFFLFVVSNISSKTGLSVVKLNVSCRTVITAFFFLPWQHCYCHDESLWYLQRSRNQAQNVEGVKLDSFISCAAETWLSVCLHSLVWESWVSWKQELARL